VEETEPQSLGAAQHWLRRLITEPGGVEVALAEIGDADGAQLAALVRGDRGLPAADRLAVYSNAYFARLHDCLRDDFGAAARALGPEAFHDLVKTYLMMHPPTRPSLRHAGAYLAEHLTTEPFAEIFSRRCPYVADLAQLEWAMAEAFYAADSPILVREELAAVAPEGWSELRFETVPSLRLLTCAWPVHVARERFDQDDGGELTGDEAPPLVAGPTWIRVWRLGESVRYRAITRLEVDALGAARDREPFAAICDRVASAVGAEEAAPQAAALLSSWVSDGLLARRL
jgi:putative DNA-binding protein